MCAEMRKKFEGDGETTVEASETAYERLLNKMFQIDDDLPLKTRIPNPIEFSRFNFCADLIESEGRETTLKVKEKDVGKKQRTFLSEEADLLRALGRYVEVYEVSDKGKGRTEGFDAIKSYNIGQSNIPQDIDAKEFKRILKNAE